MPKTRVREATPLERAAFAIAAFPPTMRSTYSRDAYVHWELIEDLRSALRSVGWNIDETLRLRDQRAKEKRRARAAELKRLRSEGAQ